MRRLLLSILLAGLAQGCASQECDFNSQCGAQRYCERGRCRQDCQNDFDCPDPGEGCNAIGQCVVGGSVDAGTDAGRPREDAGSGGFDAGFDAGPPTNPDSGPPPTPDAGPGVDAGRPTGTGRYLDRCNTGADCTSGRCVDDVGGTRMCTIACVTHTDCASEHVCSGGQCVYDDTGTVCSSPSSCELGLCYGEGMGSAAHCTRPCSSARECPAGYACVQSASGAFVCADIERGSGGATECVSPLHLSIQGCTSACRTAADCPARLPGLPPYTCEVAFGSSTPICVPPSDVLGADPIGAPCPPAATNTCRSAACDTAAPTGPMCTQSCAQEGGCGPGLGCFPEVLEGTIVLICARAGSGALGSPCSSARQCDSALCDTAGFCTRLCSDDGLCPTGMRCEPIAGFGVSFCRR